jgi:hypothetical protein
MIRRLAGSVVSVGLAVLLVAGCSSADDSQTSTPTPSSSSTSTGSTPAGSTSTGTAAPDSSSSTAAGPAQTGPTDDPSGTGTATGGGDSIVTGTATTSPTSSVEVRTTEVPAPGGGNVNETVAEVPVVTAPSVPLTEPVTQDDITVTITSVQAVTAEAVGPGEIGGPAVAVAVQIDNQSGAPLDLGSVSVVLLDSTGSPGITTTGGSAQPLAGELASGGQGHGIYVFTVPESLRSPISVSVSYSTEAPVVLFVGDAT